MTPHQLIIAGSRLRFTRFQPTLENLDHVIEESQDRYFILVGASANAFIVSVTDGSASIPIFIGPATDEGLVYTQILHGTLPTRRMVVSSDGGLLPLTVIEGFLADPTAVPTTPSPTPPETCFPSPPPTTCFPRRVNVERFKP